MKTLLLASLLVASVQGKHFERLLLVPVHVAGHGPYWFAVDTGASHTVIDPYLVKELGLKTTGAAKITGTGTGQVDMQHAAPLEVSVGNAKLTIAEPWVIDLSGVPIPKDVHGLVGAEFLENFVVELNSDRATLCFFDARTFTPPKGAVTIPLEATKHQFFIKATIDVKEKLVVEHRLRIDSGSSDSVGDPIAKEARETQESTLGAGLGNDYKSVSGKYDAVHVGPFVVRHVWGPATTFPTIGMEMLRRFTVTFDVAHGALHLQPNAHLAEPVPPPGE